MSHASCVYHIPRLPTTSSDVLLRPTMMVITALARLHHVILLIKPVKITESHRDFCIIWSIILPTLLWIKFKCYRQWEHGNVFCFVNSFHCSCTSRSLLLFIARSIVEKVLLFSKQCLLYILWQRTQKEIIRNKREIVYLIALVTGREGERDTCDLRCYGLVT